MDKRVILAVVLLISIIFIVGCSDSYDKCDINKDGKIDAKEKELCKGSVSECGDSRCGEGETEVNCPKDCEETRCTNECGDGECDYVVCKKLPCPCLETIKTCPSDCGEELPDVPWSAFYMHVEDINGYDQCFDKIIALADKYNTPLTLMLHSRIRDHILEDPVKIAKLQAWQTNGYEFGIHAQGCYGSDYCDDKGSCLKEGDAKQYTKLIGTANLKTAHVTPALFGYGDEYNCPELLPETIVYGGLGRFDGRNFFVMNYNVQGRKMDLMNVKSGYYGANPEKMAQYNLLNSDEIYFTGNHAECELTELEEWFRFLSKKDPEGKKRKTQTWIMENVIIPEGRSINEDEVTSPSNRLIEKCSQLVGEKIFADSWIYSPTDIYNFGRCIMTENFCFNDEHCVFANVYMPSQCTLGDINNPRDVKNYKPVSEVCVVVCGDSKCDQGENRLDSQIYCPEDCNMH